MRPRFYIPRRSVKICCHTLAAVLCCGAVAPSAAALRHSKDDSHHAERNAIASLEKRWRTALMQSDAAALERLLADDFISISSNGILADKQEYLREITSHRLVFTRLDLKERKIRIQESSAIVTSLSSIEGKVDGQPVSGVFRYTRVYSRKNGGAWKVVNFEATKVSGGEGPAMQNGVPIRPGVPPQGAEGPKQ